MSKVFDAYAAYYDLLYKDKDYDGEVEFIYKTLTESGIDKGRILELGCGTGKHAELLIDKGFYLHGIDMSQGMIDAANSRMSASESDKYKFELGDVRTFKTDGKFDVVVSLFHVASYQTETSDLLSMFETAAEHLDEGGVFIFDYWYGPAVLTDLPSVRVKRLEDESLKITRIGEPELHHRSNVVDVNYDILVEEKGINKVTQVKEKHCMRYLFIPELEYLLEASGFSLEKNIEWFTGSDLDISSWSAMVIARKNK